MSQPMMKRIAVGLVATAVGLAACQSSEGPTTPRPNLAVGDISASPTLEMGKVWVCKTGANGTFRVDSTSAGGPPGGTGTLVASPFGVDAGDCLQVAEALTGAADTKAINVVITETSAGLVSASYVKIENGVPSGPFAYNNGVTALYTNDAHGYIVTFVNQVPTGNNGCTPGYWKQDHHFDSWPAAYDPSDSFNATFGDTWFTSDITLLAALKRGGGGVNALARHAVAALLNAESGFYPLTTAQVIARMQATFDGTFTVEATKNFFETRNELGCPLN